MANLYEKGTGAKGIGGATDFASSLTAARWRHAITGMSMAIRPIGVWGK